MYDDERKILNKIRVKPETHDEIIKRANEIGMSIGDFAGDALDMYMTEQPVELTAIEKVHWNWRAFRLEEQQREKVHHAAAIHKEHPSDESADRLKRMCEDAGMDFAEIERLAENDPFTSIIAASRDGTKFGACLRWLPKTLRRCNGCAAVSKLRVLGRSQGYSNSMLNRVKQAINEDSRTPSIRSVRREKGWEWQLVDDREHEQQDEQ